MGSLHRAAVGDPPALSQHMRDQSAAGRDRLATWRPPSPRLCWLPRWWCGRCGPADAGREHGRASSEPLCSPPPGREYSETRSWFGLLGV